LNIPGQVELIEVGPRDELQNEPFANYHRAEEGVEPATCEYRILPNRVHGICSPNWVATNV